MPPMLLRQRQRYYAAYTSYAADSRLLPFFFFFRHATLADIRRLSFAIFTHAMPLLRHAAAAAKARHV